ncbi:hypothetical protein LSTR_LSTR012806 [Laodelphax striatellus]|uniref:Uncharacterized protein n=1 Tax=Laodelphax striatellus TaxID=195883 RepID=A0A482WSF0_LAOST|nr:hypothetical protein LSTR_LSTR012806 [Laodelphax striatellus]
MDVNRKQTVEEIAPTIKEIAKLKRDIKRKHKELTLGIPVRQHKHHAHTYTTTNTDTATTSEQALKQLQLPDIGEETPTSFEAFGDDSHFSPAPSTSGVVRKLWSNKDSPLSEDDDVPGWSMDEEDQQNESVQQLMDTSRDVWNLNLIKQNWLKHLWDLC